MQAGNGFTLVELLMVIAIIGILAAIAIPNFLQAQTRSKVARCLADMSTVAGAAELYCADHSSYPLYGRIRATGEIQYPAVDNFDGMNDQSAFVGPCITTPVAYLSQWFDDPFFQHHTVTGPMASPAGNFIVRKLEYLNMDQHVKNFDNMGIWPPFASKLVPAWGHWRMVGAGPDHDRGLDIKLNRVYDPTNGTVSDGDIVRCQRFSESRYNPEHP